MFCEECVFKRLEENEIFGFYKDKTMILYKCACCCSDVFDFKLIQNKLDKSDYEKIVKKNKRIKITINPELKEFLNDVNFYLKKSCPNFVENMIVDNVVEEK